MPTSSLTVSTGQNDRPLERPKSGLKRIMSEIATNFLRPSCLLCRFFLTFTSLLFAISGAANLRTAGLMIGTGMVLDIARSVAGLSRLTQMYWLRRVVRSAADPVYARRRNRLLFIPLYTPVAVFLLHGFLWMILAPRDPGTGATVLTSFCVEPRYVTAVSHVARSFALELINDGDPGRAQLLKCFISQTFSIYIISLIIWTTLGTGRHLEGELEAVYKRIQANDPFKASYRPTLVLFGSCMVIAFILINNLMFLEWTQRHAWETSNSFFIMYDFMMMVSYLSSGFLPAVLALQCLKITTAAMQLTGSVPNPKTPG